MKYILAILTLLSFAACNKPKPFALVCATPLGGLKIESTDPGFKGDKNGFEIELDTESTTFFIPKAQCVKIYEKTSQ